MDINTFRGVLTAILLVAFIGLWIWAWSSKRRKDFDEAARLPFRDEETGSRDSR
ncbi:MAG TPA: cbb3-type cytochrome c oxidase subunit 3 [Gammaproteobacteria bacterium]|nr:cbb3-type cytochrome c oxidase subunit 3 [Gammaproteobacteria bacterium]